MTVSPSAPQEVAVCLLQLSLYILVHGYVYKGHKTATELQIALGKVQGYVHIVAGHRPTYRQLAQIAGISQRAITEWMRGATAPTSVNAVLRLISTLEDAQIADVVKVWKSAARPSSGRKNGASSSTSTTTRRKR